MFTFASAILIGVNLTGANLSGANLSDATKLDDKWPLVWEIVDSLQLIAPDAIPPSK